MSGDQPTHRLDVRLVSQFLSGGSLACCLPFRADDEATPPSGPLELGGCAGV